MLMCKSKPYMAYKSTGSPEFEAVARKFFLSKVKTALPHLQKLGEYSKKRKNEFCAAFYAQRFSKREISFILRVLEQNGIISLNGNSHIEILDAKVLQNPQTLMHFFERI